MFILNMSSKYACLRKCILRSVIAYFLYNKDNEPDSKSSSLTHRRYSPWEFSKEEGEAGKCPISDTVWIPVEKIDLKTKSYL